MAGKTDCPSWLDEWLQLLHGWYIPYVSSFLLSLSPFFIFGPSKEVVSLSERADLGFLLLIPLVLCLSDFLPLVL